MTDAATLKDGSFLLVDEPYAHRDPDMSAVRYHSDLALGSSMAEDFRQSRRKYLARYVHRTLPEPEPSAAMNLGTLIHLKVLEPDRYSDVVADPYPELAPDGKKWYRRKGSDHEKWWADEVAKREGKIPCTVDDERRVDAAAKAVLSHKRARSLVNDQGSPEVSHFWSNPDHGIACKCRVDWDANIPIDLKTTSDASPNAYVRSVVRLGYHRKLAHYLEGLRVVRGEPTRMAHIAVETSAPYRVAVYDINDKDEQGCSLGATQRNATLRQLREAIESGDWSEPWERQVNELKLPRFAWLEDDFFMEL